MLTRSDLKKGLVLSNGRLAIGLVRLAIGLDRLAIGLVWIGNRVS